MSHEMKLIMTYPTGAEEWFCEECGRRLIMTWPPKYKRLLLDEGDQNVGHNGTKGELPLAIQVGLESPQKSN